MRWHYLKEVYGDALVYAEDARKALTEVRGKTGFIPNPGDVVILGGKKYRAYSNEVGELGITTEKLEEAKEGPVILWSSEKLDA